MSLLGIIIYSDILFSKINLENLYFSENIEYCASIMYNINLEKEFEQKCDLEKTRKYILFSRK